MELLESVEIVTTAVTFLLFASGIPACVSMVRTGHTHNVPYVYFLVSAINSTLALYYGVIVNNSTFILVITVGLLLWGTYILLYIAVSQSKGRPMSQLAVSLATVVGHGVYVTVVTPAPPALTHTLGLFLFGWTVLLCATPLLEIADIVQQGTSAGSDVFILLGSSVCGVSWLVYGYLLEDFFVYGPNVLGLAVNGAKLAAIAAYSGPPLKDKKTQ